MTPEQATLTGAIFTAVFAVVVALISLGGVIYTVRSSRRDKHTEIQTVEARALRSELVAEVEARTNECNDLRNVLQECREEKLELQHQLNELRSQVRELTDDRNTLRALLRNYTGRSE